MIKKLLFVMPESAGDVFLCTSLLRSLRETYPNYRIYFSTKPQFQEILKNNPYIDEIIDYDQNMDNLVLMEGIGSHKGYFDICFLPHAATQRFLTYMHNGEDKIAFDISY
jgi:ADP-heptose:LPS heptosyltransferase